MSLEQALAILEQVAASHVGTLADHQQIQTALKVIKEKLGNGFKS